MEPQPPATTTPQPPRPRWGVGDFFVGLFGGYALATLMGSLWFALSGEDELSLTGQALTQIGLWTGWVVIVVMASRRKGAGSLGEDFGFRARWSDLALGAVVALATQLLLLPAIALLLQPLLGEPEVSGPVRDLLDRSEGPAYLGLLASVAIGAPIVEELFFRGLLLRSLQRRLSTGKAVGVSAVVFGMAHGSTLPAEAVILVMVSLTAFGAVLALLAIRTGRLGPGIVAHAVFNLFTVLVLTFTG